MEHLMNVYASKAAKGSIAEFLGYCEVAAHEANYRLTEGLWLVSSSRGAAQGQPHRGSSNSKSNRQQEQQQEQQAAGAGAATAAAATCSSKDISRTLLETAPAITTYRLMCSRWQEAAAAGKGCK